MMFYNGFNLLLDGILITAAVLLAHGKGYRKAKAYYLNKYAPPF